MIAFLLAAAALAQAPAPPTGTAAPDSSARALAVLERTKTTRVTYAMYGWAWVQNGDGSLRDEWSAEFNSGSRHRVETPAARLVADCDAQTGTGVILATGERVEGRHVAQIACGIATAQAIREVSWLGTGTGRFGEVDRLRIVDDEVERIYTVDRDGILVGAEIYAPDGDSCLQAEAVAVERSLPEGDLFSVESLDRSVVPERYRRAPERRIGDLWTPGRSCPGEASSANY